jgi:hypothetical protein
MRYRLVLRTTSVDARLKYARETSNAVSLEPGSNARIRRTKNSTPIVFANSTSASSREKCLNAYRSLLWRE